MFKNGLSYRGIMMLVLLSHISLLGIVYFHTTAGEYERVWGVVQLALFILGSDILYFLTLRLMRQATYTIDFVLITILNMSTIFQSCFGGIGFAAKHFIMSVGCFICCQLSYLFTRNAEKTELRKPWFYGAFGLLVLLILFCTGSRSMWIDFGFITVQPSEFLKPVFVLICATSIAAQQNKQKTLGLMLVRDNFCVYGCAVLIFALQWWCRDLGSLPTFMAVAVCGLIARLSYPRAKLSKRLVLSLVAGGLLVCALAVRFAPAYVIERLYPDIWADPSGSGYQQCKALIAIAEGGWFGKGPGRGSLYRVAASNTDIVFSTICEEWGLIMALLAVGLILLLLATTLMNPPRSYFHSTVATGVCAVFIVQMALNIFGSCNLIPFTGVTIPFISQGGSSMLATGILVGFLKATQSPLFHHEAPAVSGVKQTKKKKAKRKGAVAK